MPKKSIKKWLAQGESFESKVFPVKGRVDGAIKAANRNRKPLV